MEKKNIRKEDLREYVLNIRNQMSKKDVESKSNVIINKLIKILDFENSNGVMAYVPFGKEVDTYKLLKHIIKNKGKVILPKIIDSSNIQPFFVNNLDYLKEGSYGIYEPDTGYCKECVLDEIEYVVVPGIAFSKKGQRIGRGRGCYDRFLARLTKLKKSRLIFIGLGYDFQVFESIVTDPLDIGLDMIITESSAS